LFDDLISLVSNQLLIFSDAVRDQFGVSIISQVFEPMIVNIKELQQVEDMLQKCLIEIDALTEELRSITCISR